MCGFRSFKNQEGSSVEPFSPGHNALVGRNGAGKSNFFDAVQFVLLAPRFRSLRHEEREQLLHAGARPESGKETRGARAFEKTAALSPQKINGK